MKFWIWRVERTRRIYARSISRGTGDSRQTATVLLIAATDGYRVHQALQGAPGPILRRAVKPLRLKRQPLTGVLGTYQVGCVVLAAEAAAHLTEALGTCRSGYLYVRLSACFVFDQRARSDAFVLA
eukprot:3988414-Pleurochrysis_carterae.AAC.1